VGGVVGFCSGTAEGCALSGWTDTIRVRWRVTFGSRCPRGGGVPAGSMKARLGRSAWPSCLSWATWSSRFLNASWCAEAAWARTLSTRTCSYLHPCTMHWCINVMSVWITVQCFWSDAPWNVHVDTGHWTSMVVASWGDEQAGGTGPPKTSTSRSSPVKCAEEWGEVGGGLLIEEGRLPTVAHGELPIVSTNSPNSTSLTNSSSSYNRVYFIK